MGGSGGVAQLDRALRGAPGALRGLEKHLCALRQRAGTSERRRTGNAVRAHVHTLRDTHHRRQFAAGQRPSRAGARNSSGPVGEEAAGEKDLQLRTGQPLSGTRVRRGTQSTLSASAGAGERLPSSRTQRETVAADFSSATGADDRQ